MLQRVLGLPVVAQVGRGDVDGVGPLHQFLVRAGHCGDGVGGGQCLGARAVGVVDRGHGHRAHLGGLPGEAAGYAPRPRDADLHLLVLLLAQHGRGDALGARQVDHLAVLVQVVEVAHPVAAHGEDVNVVLLYVVDLLPEVVLDDDLVGDARGADRLHALQHVVLHVELAALAVEVVVRHAHDEVVAQCLGATQQVDVALVQQVVGAVCDYFLHDVIPYFR